MSNRLSKSRYIHGLQCHKQLWWRVHERDAPELAVGIMDRYIMDQGHDVGALARDYVPGGVLIDRPHDDYDGRLADTRAALAGGAAVLYEAAFVADGVFVAVDILERTDAGWRVVEVKSATRVKPEYLGDLAVQVHVLRASGLVVCGAELMHVNRACRFPDLAELFTRVDLTAPVEELLPATAAEIVAQRAMLDGPLPVVASGDHCDAPRPCPFAARCHPAEPALGVGTLYKASRAQKERIAGAGCRTLAELSDDLTASRIQDRQRRAARAMALVVDGDPAEDLRAMRGDIAFLDFETIMLAVPRWAGCRPYDQLTVQFSVHVLSGDGSLRHVGWIADGPDDPREAIARALVDVLADVRHIFAYNAAFERSRIFELADVVPWLTTTLYRIAIRIQDLLPVVRNHVYHPAFEGSFGLKSVAPALLPHLDYSELVISSGDAASVELVRLLLRGDTMEEHERVNLRAALLRYCERDTFALRELFGFLVGLDRRERMQ